MLPHAVYGHHITSLKWYAVLPPTVPFYMHPRQPSYKITGDMTLWLEVSKRPYATCQSLIDPSHP